MSAYLEEESGHPPDEKPSDEQLAVEWFEQAGVSFSKLRISHLEEGERGAFARTDIAPGEELLRVPRRLLLTPALARSSDIGRLIHARAPSASDELLLSAFLLQERERKDSFWKPYLSTLPAAFPHLPFFFEAHELSLLRGSSMLGEIARCRTHLLEEYALLCEHVPEASRFSPDAFLWAQCTLLSRTFGLSLENQFVRCFVPLADMLNHRQSPEVIWGPSEDGTSFVLVAREPVPAGGELHISYGIKPNSRFLLNYGFVPEDNPADEIVLHLGISEDDPNAASKRKLLGLSTPASRRRFDVPLHYEGASTAAMFSFLRVACAGTEELARITTEATANGGLSMVDPLSVDTEEAVLATLGELCEARLAGFDTTLEEDERLLLEADLPRNARNCLLLRRGEKRLLHAYAGLAKAFMPMLRGALTHDEERRTS